MFRFEIAEALVHAKEILTRGNDVEMRALGGGEVVIYELKKTRIEKKEEEQKPKK